MIALALWVACTGEGDTGVDLGDPAPSLEVPDLTGVDLELAFAQGALLAPAVQLTQPWDQHAALVALGQDGCPDLYAGAPDTEDMDVEGGQSWSDYCETAGGLYFRGQAWWDTSIAVTTEDDGGATVQASRTLVADATAGDSEDLGFRFDGQAEESIYQVVDGDYIHSTWSSLVTASFDSTADATAADWRGDLYLYWTGGETRSVELRGNVYFYTTVIEDRFDSVAVELTWTAPEDSDPDGCTAEPVGWMGLRDSAANWYDLVFQPTADGDYADLPYTDCDGCGTLYVRGIEQGTYCPDLSFETMYASLTPPDVEDFVFTLRELEGP